MVVRDIDVMGQPDAIDVSHDERYIAVAIENERDEDLDDGTPPQLPAGFLVIIDTPNANPNTWTTRKVELTGLDDVLYPEDPEPEYVAINEHNIAVVTLQENNGIVLVDLPTGRVVDSFSAGDVDLDQIDNLEDSIINQVDSLDDVLREPDGVTWIGTDYFATANEGDLDGGSRGFSIFDTYGNVVYDSGNEMELLVARVGHYPDERSENKGNEPENILYSEFDDRSKYLFVLSERSSVVFVYDISCDPSSPSLLQILPAGTAPEGVVAIPSRGLLAVASEEDARGDKIRSSITIYELSDGKPTYPTLVSDYRRDGTFIPFSALSGLASASPYGLGIYGDESILYSIEDSFFKRNRILTIDTSTFPAVVTSEMRIVDSHDTLKTCLMDASVSDTDDIINADKTVNIDPEGIAIAAEGGFWVASEGRGTVGDAGRPFVSLHVSCTSCRRELVTRPTQRWRCNISPHTYLLARYS